MAEVNKEGNLRGMCFTPRWDLCVECGAPIWKDAAKRQLCTKCREKHAEIQKAKQRARSMSTYRKKKKIKIEEPERIASSTVCEVWHNCKYGSHYGGGGCGYVTITGELRSIGGKHPIIEGRCDLYQARRKRREKKG